jgi:hypothetical protein
MAGSIYEPEVRMFEEEEQLIHLRARQQRQCDVRAFGHLGNPPAPAIHNGNRNWHRKLNDQILSEESLSDLQRRRTTNLELRNPIGNAAVVDQVLGDSRSLYADRVEPAGRDFGLVFPVSEDENAFPACEFVVRIHGGESSHRTAMSKERTHDPSEFARQRIG